MRHDWNSLLVEPGDEPLLFSNYSREYFPSADDFVRYLRDYRDRFALRVSFNTTVARVERAQGDHFFLHGTISTTTTTTTTTPTAVGDNVVKNSQPFRVECRRLFIAGGFVLKKKMIFLSH